MPALFVLLKPDYTSGMNSYKEKCASTSRGQVQGTFIHQYNCGHISNYTAKTILVRTTATVIQNLLGQGSAIKHIMTAQPNIH